MHVSRTNSERVKLPMGDASLVIKIVFLLAGENTKSTSITRPVSISSNDQLSGICFMRILPLLLGLPLPVNVLFNVPRFSNIKRKLLDKTLLRAFRHLLFTDFDLLRSFEIENSKLKLKYSRYKSHWRTEGKVLGNCRISEKKGEED